VRFSDHGQRGHQPERADGEGALVAIEPGVGSLFEDLGLDLLGARPPPLGAFVVAALFGQSAPRPPATKHITLDAVKCLGSPRTSQMP
jgi:hypothetical protein